MRGDIYRAKRTQKNLLENFLPISEKDDESLIHTGISIEPYISKDINRIVSDTNSQKWHNTYASLRRYR